MRLVRRALPLSTVIGVGLLVLPGVRDQSIQGVPGTEPNRSVLKAAPGRPEPARTPVTCVVPRLSEAAPREGTEQVSALTERRCSDVPDGGMALVVPAWMTEC